MTAMTAATAAVQTGTTPAARTADLPVRPSPLPTQTLLELARRGVLEALGTPHAGDRYAAAAAKIGISESALKARLASARTALLARTTTEAIQRARDYRLI